MDPLLAKLEYNPERDDMVIVLHPPRELEDVWPAWQEHGVDVGFEAVPAMPVVLVFAAKFDEIERHVDEVIGHLAGDDPRLWFGYRTDSAPDNATDINAVGSWPALTERGYEPVRQIAIDENWSALRFRQTEAPATP